MREIKPIAATNFVMSKNNTSSSRPLSKHNHHLFIPKKKPNLQQRKRKYNESDQSLTISSSLSSSAASRTSTPSQSLSSSQETKDHPLFVNAPKSRITDYKTNNNDDDLQQDNQQIYYHIKNKKIKREAGIMSIYCKHNKQNYNYNMNEDMELQSMCVSFLIQLFSQHNFAMINEHSIIWKWLYNVEFISKKQYFYPSHAPTCSNINDQPHIIGNCVFISPLQSQASGASPMVEDYIKRSFSLHLYDCLKAFTFVTFNVGYQMKRVYIFDSVLAKDELYLEAGDMYKETWFILLAIIKNYVKKSKNMISKSTCDVCYQSIQKESKLFIKIKDDLVFLKLHLLNILLKSLFVSYYHQLNKIDGMKEDDKKKILFKHIGYELLSVIQQFVQNFEHELSGEIERSYLTFLTLLRMNDDNDWTMSVLFQFIDQSFAIHKESNF